VAGGAGLNGPIPATRRGQNRLDLILLLTALANRAYSIALVVYVYDATHSSAWVAAAAGARYLPGVLTSSLAPPLLDRFPPRSVLIWSDLCCTVAVAAMATAVQLGASPAIPIALAAAVRAAASGQAPAAARLLPVVAGGRDLSHVAARHAVIDKLMLLVGPALGGLLLLAVSPAAEMYALAALVGVAAGVSLGLPDPAAIQRPSRPGTSPTGWRAHATGNIATFIGVAAVSGFVYGTDTVLLAVLANTRLHLGSAGYGELFAGLGAGGLAATPVINRLTQRTRLAAWLALAVAMYCLPSVLIAYSHAELPAIALEAVRGAGSLAVDLIVITELQRIVLPQGLPLLTARLTSIVFGSVAIGALVTPVLLHALGTTGTFVALGLVPPVLVAMAYPALRLNDRQTSLRLAELGPRIAVLEPLGLLQATSRPVLERLAAAVTELSIPADTVVVTEGEIADAFYVVLSGELEVLAGERRINVMRPGDWFGEIGLLEGRRRTASVRSQYPCDLYRIDGSAFLDAFSQLPASASLLDSVAGRLASSELAGRSADLSVS
jgi:hypothetical protein